MWIFTRYGFFSIVNGRRRDGSPDPDTVMVRARRVAHLRQLLQRCPSVSGAEITTTLHRDYRYRIVVAKVSWVAAITALAEEQNWCNFKAEVGRHQGAGGSDYTHALHSVWSVMNEFQRAETRFALVNRDADGAITNAADLVAEDVVGEKVLCPACGRKTFASWPEGWDGHAGHACTIEGDTPEERKTVFKRRYRLLFR
jgi:hypothetical protein